MNGNSLMILGRIGPDDRYKKTDDVKKILESNRVGKFAKEFYDRDQATNMSESLMRELEGRSIRRVLISEKLRQYVRNQTQKEQKNESNVLLNHQGGFGSLGNHVGDEKGRLETQERNPYLKKSRSGVTNLETGRDY